MLAAYTDQAAAGRPEEVVDEDEDDRLVHGEGHAAARLERAGSEVDRGDECGGRVP